MMRGRTVEGECPETSKETHLHFPVAGSKFDSSPAHLGRVLFETQYYIGNSHQPPHGEYGDKFGSVV